VAGASASTTSATMQVMLSGPPPAMASAIRSLAAWSGSVTSAQHAGDRLGVRDAVQPVGAQQVPVLPPGFAQLKIGLEVAVGL